MMEFIAQILSPIIRAIYNVTNGNYVLALVLFTLIVKILMLPLSIKQQRSMMAQQRIQPKVAALQEKYKDDREKLNEETIKLYEKEGVSPTGGCLPLLIQFPILIGLYRIIQRPLTYILALPAASIVEKINENAGAFDAPFLAATGNTAAVEAGSLTLEQFSKYAYNIEIAVANKLDMIDFNLFGINLAETPEFNKISALWILPILAAASTFLSTYVTKWMADAKAKKEGKDVKKKDPQQGQPNMTMMNIMMSGMTLMFGFSLPNALAFYWVISSVLGIAQQAALKKFIKD